MTLRSPVPAQVSKVMTLRSPVPAQVTAQVSKVMTLMTPSPLRSHPLRSHRGSIFRSRVAWTAIHGAICSRFVRSLLTYQNVGSVGCS